MTRPSRVISTLNMRPGKRRQLPQQVRIVADLPRGGAVHAVDARRAVGAAEEDFVAERMALARFGCRPSARRA